MWLQMLKRNIDEPKCQSSAVCSLAEQLAKQKAMTKQQQQEILGLHEQLAAQQQVAAEQSAQIAELQRQLQELMQPKQQ